MSEENFKLNSVLCYICSARNSLDKEIIISSIFNFYTKSDISDAKNLIYGYTEFEPKRRTGEGKAMRDITDILDILTEIDEKSIVIPVFVTKEWNSLPPPNSEFGPLSRNVTNLSEIIFDLNNELQNFQKNKDNDKNFEEHLLDIKEDIADIKKTQIIQQQKSSSIEQHLLITAKNKSSANAENINFSIQHPTVSKSPPSDKTSYSSIARIPQFRPPPVYNNNNPRKRKIVSTSLGIDLNQSLDDEVQILQPNKPNHEVQSFQANKPNDEGWTLVDSRSKRKNFKNNSIIGSGNFATESWFSSAPRSLDLFIGGCSINTKEEEIINFCEKNHNIKVKCNDMNSKSEFRKSFKVTVDINDRDKLLNTNMWPNGVIVRKFTNKRNNTFGNFNSSK